MPLTDTRIKAVRPSDKPQKLFDGGGLYLEVSPSGGRWWRLKYRFAGKEKRLSLGVYPDVSLQQARRAREELREMLKSGTDPSAARQMQRSIERVAAGNSFESVARAWHSSWSRTRTAKHAAQVMRRLELDVFPQIGAQPVDTIRPPQIVALAKLVEKRGAHDLARRAIQISGQVFRYAIGHGLAENNPAASIKPSDVLAPVRVRNYNRVELSEVPGLLRAINNYHGHIRTRLAMHLMSLTFVRTSELIAARWTEVNFEARQWRILAGRTKMETQHIVHLSRQTVQVLLALRESGTGQILLFPGCHDHEKPMSNNTILSALYRLGYKGQMTGHGFRGVASTALHEMGHDHAFIEAQLAHLERNKVSAAYNHAKYLPQRAQLMQDWADWLDEQRGEPMQLSRIA